MALTCLIVFVTLQKVTGDWVEITQVLAKNSPKPEEPVSTSTSTTTTSSPSYEVFMKTPTKTLELTTIPTINTTAEYHSTVVKKNLQENQTVPSNVQKINSSDELKSKQDEDNHLDEAIGFLPFLKKVQSNLMSKMGKTVYNKLAVLTKLRNHLLYEIQKRMEKLWQPNSGSEARGYKDEHSGHMDFPSNEGALMTIGFLTFAVFLIKLVLKLIHALKYKQQYYNMVTVPPATTGTATVYIGRRKREVDEALEEERRILEYIEEYKFF